MTWGNVRAAALVVLPALAAAFCLSKPMAAYQMGEAYARSVGINVRAFSRLLVLLSSLLAACVTAFAGPSPLWASRCPIWSSSCSAVQGRWWCCPGAAWAGRPSACCATHRPQQFAPTELSISAVTAVFGAPVVIWLLVRGVRRVCDEIPL